MSTGIVRLAGPKIREKGFATVREEKLGGDEKSGGWGGWGYVDHGMALRRERGYGALECTGTSWRWVDDSLKRLN